MNELPADYQPTELPRKGGHALSLLIGGVVTMVVLIYSLTAVPMNDARKKAEQSAETMIPEEFRTDDAERLTREVGNASYQNACFSPDGAHLVYTRWRDGYNTGPADVMIRDLEKGIDHLLVGDSDSANVNVPFGCWRGTTIVFSSDREGLTYDEIWTINSDGTDLRRLTNHTSSLSFIEPVFSPDGTHIAFEIDRLSATDEQLFGQIWTMKSDGSNLKQLTGTVATDDRLPSWSNNGELLFQRRVLLDDGSWSDWDIVITEPQTTDTWSSVRNLTGFSEAEETDNSWSPDSELIVSSSDYGGISHPNIFAFPRGGGEPIRLTNNPDGEDGAASISSDGRWLVFESHRTSDAASPSDLWLKELDQPVTQPAQSPSGTKGTTWWQPTPGASFQWQLSQLPVDTTIRADIYELDGFDADTAVINELHQQGRKVLCYVDVGSWEEFRPDKDQFPKSLIGHVYDGYPDERWLDIRQLDQLGPILEQRFDICRDRGFDGVEADNVDGFEQSTGFPLTANDQLRFNRWIAEQIHRRGMAAALKNDGTQAAELVSDFDLVVTEECVVQKNCDEYAVFRSAGKLHLNAEYTDTPVTNAAMCAEAKRAGMTSILKNRNLDTFRQACQ